jgi:putative tryptophan/tyrosine transport system substrate-binding protein
MYSFSLHACNSISLISSNSRCHITQRIESSLFQNPHFHLAIQHYLVNKTPSNIYQTMQNQHCLVVTIGSEALEAALKNQVELPILSVLTRKHHFKQLLNQYNRTLNDPNKPIFVIYLDQPLSRQLDLLKVLFCDKQVPKMGVLLSHDSYSQQSTIQHISKEKNIVPHIAFVNEVVHPIATLNNLLKNVDVVLAIPDPKIYHAGSVRGILLTAFHHHMPIIGYSHTLVNNGALACVYSTAKQISEQTTKTIISITQDQTKWATLPKEQDPNDFNVAINYQVAKSLGFSLPNQETIKSKIEIQ